jgi:hypothetical protein
VLCPPLRRGRNVGGRTLADSGKPWNTETREVSENAGVPEVTGAARQPASGFVMLSARSFRSTRIRLETSIRPGPNTATRDVTELPGRVLATFGRLGAAHRLLLSLPTTRATVICHISDLSAGQS